MPAWRISGGRDRDVGVGDGVKDSARVRVGDQRPLSASWFASPSSRLTSSRPSWTASSQSASRSRFSERARCLAAGMRSDACWASAGQPNRLLDAITGRAFGRYRTCFPPKLDLLSPVNFAAPRATPACCGPAVRRFAPESVIFGARFGGWNSSEQAEPALLKGCAAADPQRRRRKYARETRD